MKQQHRSSRSSLEEEVRHGHRTQTGCRPRATGAARLVGFLGKSVTKTYAITRGGAEGGVVPVPGPGSQYMDMQGMWIAGAAQQCQGRHNATMSTTEITAQASKRERVSERVSVKK